MSPRFPALAAAALAAIAVPAFAQQQAMQWQIGQRVMIGLNGQQGTIIAIMGPPMMNGGTMVRVHLDSMGTGFPNSGLVYDTVVARVSPMGGAAPQQQAYPPPQAYAPPQGYQQAPPAYAPQQYPPQQAYAPPPQYAPQAYPQPPTYAQQPQYAPQPPQYAPQQAQYAPQPQYAQPPPAYAQPPAYAPQQQAYAQPAAGPPGLGPPPSMNAPANPGFGGAQ